MISHITLFTHSFKLIHICWAYNHMVRFPQSPGTNTHWMRVCAQGLRMAGVGVGAAGRGTGEGKRRKKKTKQKLETQLQPLQLGVSTDNSKAPGGGSPLAQAGGSGKASRGRGSRVGFCRPGSRQVSQVTGVRGSRVRGLEAARWSRIQSSR